MKSQVNFHNTGNAQDSKMGRNVPLLNISSIKIILMDEMTKKSKHFFSSFFFYQIVKLCNKKGCRVGGCNDAGRFIDRFVDVHNNVTDMKV